MFITVITLVIVIIDIEHQLIYDSFVFWGLAIILPFITWEYLLAGFGAALFLLLVHLFTKGRGMGLGDVKLAILIGAMLGIKFTLIWMLLAFLTGAGAGVILILLNKSTLKTKIAFGPFLILAFFIVLFFKSNLNAIFLF
jgi:prepilin signal peptidase PulO-like enzyme (type II secretory pathway)